MYIYTIKLAKQMLPFKATTRWGDKKFKDFYDILKFVLIYTTVYPLVTTLCNVKTVTLWHLTFSWHVLILSSYTRLFLERDLMPSRFSAQILYAHLSSSIQITWIVSSSGIDCDLYLEVPVWILTGTQIILGRLILFYFSRSMQPRDITLLCCMTGSCQCCPALWVSCLWIESHVLMNWRVFQRFIWLESRTRVAIVTFLCFCLLDQGRHWTREAMYV
jgi:hypothetical protein